MITLELSSFTVKLKDAFTYGDVEAVNATVLSGMKLKQSTKDLRDLKERDLKDVEFDAGAMITAKHKGIERCIVEITSKEGTVIPFTMKWLEDLTKEDGLKLELTVEEIKNDSTAKK